MEELRKLHNQQKRVHILRWVEPRSFVLDCGCGRGGDWHKWKASQARVAAVDPDPESLKEAENRAIEMGFGVWFLGPGDVRTAVASGPFDVVCYNFSMHYIFEDAQTLEESLGAIERAVKPGGLLIGITPEKARIKALGIFTDRLGNSVRIEGDRAIVHVVDGPFYAEGARSEPLLDAEVLVPALLSRGFKLLVWEPMLKHPNGLISDIYTNFVFKKL